MRFGAARSGSEPLLCRAGRKELRITGPGKPPPRIFGSSQDETALADAGAVDRTAVIGGAAKAGLWCHPHTGSTDAHTWRSDTWRTDPRDADTWRADPRDADPRGANDGRAGNRVQHHARLRDAALRHTDIIAIDDGAGIGRRGHGQEGGGGKGNRGKGAAHISLP